MGSNYARYAFVCLLFFGTPASLAGFCPGLDGGPGDFDGDGVVAANDCNDEDLSLQSAPGQVEELRLFGSSISWIPPRDPGGFNPPIYNLYRAVDATFVSSSCIGTALDQPFATDVDVPQPNGIFFYLAESENACGGGGVGTDSSGQPRLAQQCDCSSVCDDGDACTQDSCGSGACLNEPIPPIVRRGPAAATACNGGDADFSVLAEGTGNLSYQWTVGGVPTGPDSPVLRLSSLSSAIDDGAEVRVEITDGCASTLTAPVRLSVLSSANSCAGGLDGQESPTGATRMSTDVGPLRWMAPEMLRRQGPGNGTSWRLNKLRGAVHLHSGEYTRTELDLYVPGRISDFGMSRVYRSRELVGGTLGPQWTHSYERSVSPDPAVQGNLLVHDGTMARVDSYAPSPTLQNCFESPGFFRTLCAQPDGRFVLTFPDRLEWIFQPLDGLPAEGKIEASVDRNGNAMQFQYDPQGRLATVIDTLGRPFDFAYDLNGQLETLTDFSGRVVTYDYYENNDFGGSAGDLKSVTSPAVVGTPNGNDFPNGKTRTYTYTTGFADFRLNHNLVSVADHGGAVYVYVRYGATELPVDGRYDRVSDTVWYPDCDNDGAYDTCDTSGNTTSFVYAQLPFDQAVPQTVSSTVVTDRAGNVSRYDYDGAAQLLRARHHTGRAPNADAPSDTIDNAPANPLRPSDPPSYDTLWLYGGSGLIQQEQRPNGSTTQFFYDGANPDPRLRARTLERVTDPGPVGGDQPQIVESWSYGDPFGDNVVPGATGPGADVGTGIRIGRFAESYTDGRGLTAIYDFDPNGNQILSSEPQVVTGTIDGLPQTIEQSFFYNAFGQLIETTTPGGRIDNYTYHANGPSTGYLASTVIDFPGEALTTLYDYDLVGNVTQITDPKGNVTQVEYNALNQPVRVTEAAPFLYTTDTWYDENDNVVRVDRVNVDETGTTRPNAYLSDAYDYDLLDRVVERSSEVEGGGVCVVERFEYDANDNVTRHESGEATNGNQPDNAVDRVYDERDLLFVEVRGNNTPDQSSTARDYDANGNVVAVRTGLESPTGSRDTTFVYDGYDRMVLRTDPLGTTLTHAYDANDNIVTETIDEAGQPAVRLSERRCLYDEADRIVVCECDHLIAGGGGNPIGDGLSTESFFYDPDGRVIRVEDDNGNGNIFDYDTVRRLAVEIDDLGNEVGYEYDANSNVTRMTRLDRSGLGLGDETYVTDYAYDELDRHVSTTDNQSNLWQVEHDSRHDRTVEIDPRGNVVRTFYDGLHRPLEVHQELTDTGTGAGTVIDTVVTLHRWDDNHRLASTTDPNGNTTTYGYDAFDDIVRVDLPDGRFLTREYTVHRDIATRNDYNGTVIDTTYDSLSRPVAVSIAPAAGVGGTTFESYVYDGLSRLVSATDDDSVVTFTYDTLDNIVEETQQISGGAVYAVSQSHDGASNLLQRVYPGGRTIDYTYDALDRVSGVLEGPTSLSSYLYIGPQRVEFRTHGSGARTNYEYDTLARMTRSLHTVGPTPVLDIGATYDPLGNLTQLRDDLTQGRSVDYSYDSIYRLSTSVHNEPGQQPAPESYQFDLAGNRQSVSGGPEAGLYLLDATLPDPGDFQCNQYTETPRGARSYSDNGTTLSADDRTGMIYDYADRLIEVTTPQGTVEYVYDAIGRRLRSASAVGVRLYTFASADVVEELDGAGTSQVTYVYGAGGLAEFREEADQNFDAVLDSYSVHHDYAGHARALTTAAGGLVERYEYDDYGLPQVFDGAGTPLGNSSRRGNPYLFHGERWDGDTRLYVHGPRYYDPSAGRHLTRGNPLYNEPVNKSSNPMYVPASSMYGGGGGGTTASGRGISKTQIRPDGISRFRAEYDNYAPIRAVSSGPGYNSSRSNNFSSVTGGGGSGGSIWLSVKKGYDYYQSSSQNRSSREGADYNSSRSNKSHTSIAHPGGGGGGGRAVEATDHNSSRSNKTSSTVAPNGGGGGGGGGRAVEATDHNSSRSNKTSSIAGGGGGTSYSTGGGGGRAVEATDHNSSRSNKTSSIAAPPGGGGGGGRIAIYFSKKGYDYYQSSSQRHNNDHWDVTLRHTGRITGYGIGGGTGSGMGGARSAGGPGGVSTGAIIGIVVGGIAAGCTVDCGEIRIKLVAKL